MLAVSGLLAFNALLFWVATGPRSLAVVTPYIESALSGTKGGYDVKIANTVLIWDGWRHPIDIRLKDIKILTKEGEVFTTLPEIALGVDLFYLPFGKVMPTSLTISAPLINIVRNNDKSFSLGVEQNAKAEAEIQEEQVKTAPVTSFSEVFNVFLNQDKENSFRRLRTVIIRDAGFRMKDSIGRVLFYARDLNLSLNRDKHGKIILSSNANVYYDNYSTSIRAGVFFDPNSPDIIDGNLEFSEVMPDILAGLFSDDKQLQQFAVPVSGKADITLDTKGNLQYLQFFVHGSKGKIISDKMPSDIDIDSLTLEGKLTNNLRNLQIKKFEAAIKEIKIEANAGVRFFELNKDSDATPEISANILIKNISASDIAGLWPPSLSPLTRDWVTQNIISGKVSEAKLTLDIKKGDLAKPLLPKEAINADLSMNNLKIRYIPEHPEVFNVNGNIHIDGVSLAADIDSADYLENTKLSNGSVKIDDLNADNPYITVALHADAPAKDIVYFLDLPRLKHAEHLGLKVNEVKGSVSGNAEVGFNFFAPEGKSAEDAIIYNVKADVNEILQKGFLGKFDIAEASGKVSVNNKGVEFSGKGKVNGAVANEANVKYLFVPDKGVDTFINIVNANSSTDNLKRFGYPEFPFIKGNIGVKANIELGNGIEKANAELDFTDCKIDWSEISLRKQLKDAATLKLSTEKKANSLIIKSFEFVSKNASAEGSAEFSGEFSEGFSGLSSLSLRKFNISNNNITHLDYTKTEAGMNINVNASSLDLTSLSEKGDEGFSFKNFPAITLKADIERLIMGDNKELTKVKGMIVCGTICTNALFTGFTTGNSGGNGFSAEIYNDRARKRHLSVKAGDAGAFLSAIGVMDGLNGGKLNISGIYKEQKNGSILNGKMEISEYTVKGAPILGRILSLASLTGFIDALQGNGIRFKELDIPFTLYNDVITIKDGKTFGSAIGITVDGTITFPKKTMDLQGTVVPSYTLNSVFGKVPLLGDILVGGEGQGVFAARYSVKGTGKEPDVGVNPLSILTPGFLRNLFDIF